MAAVEPALAHRLRVAFGRISRHLRTVDNHGTLTWSQAALLGRLETHGETTAAALAAAEGVRPQSMAATIDTLEREGFLFRRPDEEDRRQLKVSITESGRAVVRASRASKEQWLAQAIAKRFSAEEIQTLRAAAGLLERLTEDER